MDLSQLPPAPWRFTRDCGTETMYVSAEPGGYPVLLAEIQGGAA